MMIYEGKKRQNKTKKFDKPMKAGSLVSIAVLTGAQLTEVTFVVNEPDGKDLTGCLGNNIVIQLEDNATSWRLVDGYVKKNVASQ